MSCEKKETTTIIRIGHSEYNFDTAIAYVIKGVLDQQESLSVELYKLADSTMFRTLAKNEIDIAISAWLPNTHSEYIKKYPYEIHDLGIIHDSLGLYIAVPDYAPFNSIEELHKYSNLLDNKIIIPDNQNAIYSLGKDIIEDYNLKDFSLYEMSWDDITKHIEKSLNQTSGFAVISIRPHYIYHRYNIKSLTDPKNSFGEFEYASIYSNSLFIENTPSITNFLANMKFSKDDLEFIMDLNQTLGTEPYENAMRWIEQNNIKINQWLINN
jgi:glycine betaine/proline transport system substrate-binding protein